MALPTAAATAGIVLVLFASSSVAAAFKFNVTEILDEFPEFTVFNTLLSQTNLADEINHRHTVTVLVVDDSAAAAIKSLPMDTQQKVLAVHVLLDYYDPVKLNAIKEKTALLATLFQATGSAAAGRMGFINYTQGADDQMAFGSAEPGAPLSSQLVKVVASQPYNISVMQVSAAIVPPGIASPPSESNTPPSTPVLANSPVPAMKGDTSEVMTAIASKSDTDPAASSDYVDDGAVAPATDTTSPASEVALANADMPLPPPTSPSNETSVNADAAVEGTTTTSSAGSRAVVGACVGLMALVVFISI